MKIEKKFIIVIIMMMILNMIFNINFSYAGRPNIDGLPDKKTTTSEKIFDKDITDYDPTKEKIPDEINEKVGKVLGVIQIVGTTVAVLALMVIGLKTMTGSLEEKAAYKQALPGYVVGAILVAAISWLPTFIYNMVNGI